MDFAIISYLGRKKLYSKLKSKGIIKMRPLFDKEASIQRDFYGRSIISSAAGNNLIYSLLDKKKPAMIARIGTIEMGTLNTCMLYEKGIIKNIPDMTKKMLHNNAGYFGRDNIPTDEEMLQFLAVYRNAIHRVDMLASFENHAEDYFIKKNASDEMIVAQLCSLEPYYFENPWSRVLENKRVLVIHPFASSIENQFNNRDKLFGESEILPPFTLETIQAVQTIGENKVGFNDWFEALDYMKEQIIQKDFDIAIIGCGAYGFPLAAYVKDLGKKAIVMAGATQLLFGIKGKRWDNNPIINRFYNDYWVRPTIAEKPNAADSVENGCYW